MGAIMRLKYDGDKVAEPERHVSTGKVPYVAGQEHEPQWGDWLNDGPLQVRHCQFEACDIDDYR